MKQLRMPLLVLLALVLAACSRPVPKFEHEVLRTEPWSQNVIDEMESVAVQDNGREKPFGSTRSTAVVTSNTESPTPVAKRRRSR